LNKAISRVRLSPRMLELMHLRASQINGCGVCAVQHPKIARKLGETDDRIFAVAAWRDAPFFTDAERAALALTERWDAARTVPPHGRTSGQRRSLGVPRLVSPVHLDEGVRRRAQFVALRCLGDRATSAESTGR
jgi:AhpD family alkylhydroperoxidase